MSESIVWWNSLESNTRDGIISSLYTAYITGLKSMNRDLQKEFDIEKKAIVDNFVRELEIKDCLLSEKDSTINRLVDRDSAVDMSSLEDKLNGLLDEVMKATGRWDYTNYEKGEMGESSFDRIIRKTYINEDILVDTSQIRGSGDRILNICGKKIIVEIKNLNQKSMESCISRYKKTLVTHILESKTESNVGILCNMSGAELPCRGKLSYHMENTNAGKVCILTITDVSNNEYILKSAISLACILSELISIKVGSHHTAVSEMIPVVKSILDNMSRNGKLIDELRKSNKTSVTSIELVLDKMNKIINPESDQSNDVDISNIADVYKEMMSTMDKVTKAELKRECIKNGIDAALVNKVDMKTLKKMLSEVLIEDLKTFEVM